MDFQTKIKELDFIHSRLRAERLALEARTQHDLNLKTTVFQVKQEQVTLELQKLEKWRLEMKARHKNLQTEVKTVNTSNLLLRKE
jgi:hypothetical protein